VEPGGFVQVNRRHARVRESDFVLHDTGYIVGVSEKRGAVVTYIILERLERQGAGLFDKIFHAVRPYP
jgi:hypothetical protein